VAPGWVLHPRKQRSGSRIVPATRPGGPSPTGHKGPRHPPWSQCQPWGPRPPCPVTQPSYLPTRTPTGPPSGVSLVSAKEDMHVHGRKNQSSNGRGVHVTITSRSGQESGVRPARPSSMMMILLLFLQKQNLVSAIYLFGLGTRLSGPGSLGELGGVLSLLPVNPSQCPFVQMTDTDVAFLLYYRSCPCDRHDLYLPSIPASLQTLGRCECPAASAIAPHGLRPLPSWTFDKKNWL